MLAAIGIIGIFIGIALYTNNSTQWFTILVGFDYGWITTILVISGILLAWGLVDAFKKDEK